MRGSLLLICLLFHVSNSTAQTTPPLSPVDAIKKLKVPDDIEVTQVLSDPEIAQPLFLQFDERGRLWLVEYRQYPYPAGLKILSEDRHLRATYDKVPPPPPNHFVGKDRISIHEDTDGDGKYDSHKVFVEGLNIVTSFAKGRGGVFVLNPPYLLFYPDKDQDDVPDGDPEVLLEGFGLEDTHSCVNNLQFGPDGWLYAAQGSTVTGQVRKYGSKDPPIHTMGQLIWRYHPEKKIYEIFSEGGGNAFGLEIDAMGRVFSGHNGGDTRGFHYVQGGYLQKGFSKHGQLSNPYAFGYFPPMKHPAVPRFTHAFEIYESTTLPDRYHRKIVAVAPLQGHVVVSQISPDKSSFQTQDIEHLTTSEDPWFRPVNVTVGPDGALYVCDLYEGKIAHLDHHAGQVDPTNGRVYRLQKRGTKSPGTFDYRKSSNFALANLLAHEQEWHRETARRILGDRNDPAIVPSLILRMERENYLLALDNLWAIHLSGGLDDAATLKALKHLNDHVRAWTVRLACDDHEVSPVIAEELVRLAQSDPSVIVRSQLACSAKRLPASSGLPILKNLMLRTEDIEDIHVPLLVWWGIESKCDSDREMVLEMLEETPIWNSPFAKSHILSRLMRRFAQAGTRKDLVTCAQLLKKAPSNEHRDLLMVGFEEAFQGRAIGSLPVELAEALAESGRGSVLLGVRQGDPKAIKEALELIGNDKTDVSKRLQLVNLVGEVRVPGATPVLLKLIETGNDDVLRSAALTSLQLYDDPEIPTTVIGAYEKLSEESRATAQTLLSSREAWALRFTESIEEGKIEAKTVPPEVARRMTAFRDEGLVARIKKIWGNIEGATTEEMQAEIARLDQIVKVGGGNPYRGRKLFLESCAKCHQLFTDGAEIGPNLTPYKRDDVSSILLHVVNPSAEIREGYELVVVETKDGRQVQGFVVDKDPQVLVLKGADGQRVSVSVIEIEETVAQKRSLMPEGLLKELTEQQVRDLFGYLRSTQPLPDNGPDPLP